jgi:prepilin-type N-terminal cleavage/methylation domain-containing protein
VKTYAAGLRRRARFCFTLIELLVVIAIISVLCAMLTPALGSARDKTRDIKCGQNMRQIQMAVVMYANDHNNIYMSPLTFDTQYLQLVYFSNIITKYDFYRCPASNRDTTPAAPTWAWWSTTINGQTQWTEYKLNDQSGIVGKPLDGVLRPQRMAIVIDGQDWNPRHRGAKESVCFFDGHVELMTYDQYNGVEPGSTTGNPVGWYNWGINPY